MKVANPSALTYICFSNPVYLPVFDLHDSLLCPQQGKRIKLSSLSTLGKSLVSLSLSLLIYVMEIVIPALGTFEVGGLSKIP